jgi:hypothetical protein
MKLLWYFLTNTVVVDPKDSTALLSKSAIGRDLKPFQSTFHYRNLSAKIHLEILYLNFSLQFLFQCSKWAPPTSQAAVHLFPTYLISLQTEPITVAMPYKTCTAFARTEVAIVGSNPTQGMDV